MNVYNMCGIGGSLAMGDAPIVLHAPYPLHDPILWRGVTALLYGTVGDGCRDFLLTDTGFNHDFSA